MQTCGLGDSQALFNVYIANRPSLAPFDAPETVIPVDGSNIKALGDACGNGWRKVFNVYAKLLYAMDFGGIQQRFRTWQHYRDEELLQIDSGTALIYSPPSFNRDGLTLIMGKQYARSLPFADKLTWLDEQFAVCPPAGVVVCPYFDYRQLSNAKIMHLITLLNEYSLIPTTHNLTHRVRAKECEAV